MTWFKKPKPRAMFPSPNVCEEQVATGDHCKAYWDGSAMRQILKVSATRVGRSRKCYLCGGYCTLGRRVRLDKLAENNEAVALDHNAALDETGEFILPDSMQYRA